jgi:class 3 adenylate cyclase
MTTAEMNAVEVNVAAPAVSTVEAPLADAAAFLAEGVSHSATPGHMRNPALVGDDPWLLSDALPVSYRYPSLEDFLTANELTVDGVLDDGWGASLSVKGRELEATILFADITDFSGRTADLTPAETLAYVNTFFAWITAEALRDTPAIVDKYIGDEVMVVYAREFGSKNPFVDAVRAARWMCENDVLDFAPHIGIASGPVIVGYVGTPLRHGCSVFGAPVALAARCAGVPARTPEDKIASHTITFPAAEWGDRAMRDVIEPKRYRDPETGQIEDDDFSVQKWDVVEPFDFDAKGIGSVELRQLLDRSFRINPFTVEDRMREAIQDLRDNNRYWPDGRHAQAR